MFFEFVLRFRDKRHWRTARATVSTHELRSAGRSGQFNDISFFYRPEGSEIQGGTISADSSSGLYELRKGDSFDVQFDPTSPARFYCAELETLSRDASRIIAPIILLWITAIILLNLYKYFFPKQ